MRIVGVLLAAGASVRFGGDKLLAHVQDGLPMGAAAARSLAAALPDSLAVIRPQDAMLGGLMRGAGLRVVLNPQPERGMSFSIALGVAGAAGASGWLIALADMPRVKTGTIAALAASVDRPDAIAVPFHGGRRGNPVAFGAAWRGDLCALTGDRGARGLIDANPHCLCRVDVDDPGILADVDTPADLATLAARTRG